MLLLAALAANNAPAMAAVMSPLQHVEGFAACRARFGALVRLPFWPPVRLGRRRDRALRQDEEWHHGQDMEREMGREVGGRWHVPEHGSLLA